MNLLHFTDGTKGKGGVITHIQRLIANPKDMENYCHVDDLNDQTLSINEKIKKKFVRTLVSNIGQTDYL